jgi:hypothetical protein
MAFCPTLILAGVDFNRDVRPILSDKCFACHGPDEHERKADLRLDTRAGALADLGGYQAIVPGDLKKSVFIERILHDDPDEIMPPTKAHKPLDAKEIDILTKWIKDGAAYAEAWTYVPPKETHVPKPAKNSHWIRNDIDSFILSRLQEEGLSPSPPADPNTLVRRLSFDLTGLPPAPERVRAFSENPDDQAYEQLVDELLASSHYGERMAMYWLDLVRYADTVGYHGDQDHNASPYRDYVIDAFNRNLPFDQFTREQLAGDLLPSPTLSQKVATCYNRLLQTSHEGGIQEKEYLAIYAADRVRNVSAVWMGATLGCAQCHDHKYDPYTTKDFYSMASFFADVDEAQHFKVGSNTLPTKRPPEILFPTDDQKIILDEILKDVTRLEAETKNAEEAKKVSRKTLDAARKGNAPDAELKELQNILKEAEEKEKQLRAQLKEARTERDKLKRTILSCMVTESIEPRTIRILPRGNWMDDSGEIVQPAIPEFMGTLETPDRPTRLDLANWLVSDGDSGLLTARVQMNRLWYLFFGTGISRSLEDFGGQGEPPANPELLDFLAIDFVRNNWDVKAMIKKLVMTSAYRQSSIASAEQIERDPSNQLVDRQSRFRLPAEMIRDHALSVSGLLVFDGGGRPAKPYQPEGYYRHFNFPPRTYQQDNNSNQWKRGVYVHWQRQFLHPMLKAFDAPSREECTAQRPISNTPTAALVLLNDPTFVEAARMLAARLISAHQTTPDRIQLATELVWGRKPTANELSVLQDLLSKELAHYKQNPDEANKLVSVGLKPLPDDLDPNEVAGWTALARAVLSTNESITRN